MRKIFANIISAFIPGRRNRHYIRARLKTPIRKYVRFVKTFSKSHHPNVKSVFGYRCANLVVILDNKYVFKFPIRDDGRAVSEREKRITDALRPISPIKIPKMDIFDCDGVAVRRYEYVAGIGYHALDKETQIQYADKIAKQIAKFLYVTAGADPVAIRNLKPMKNMRAQAMRGWHICDLWENFILDPKTMDVRAVIDWEGAQFGDFYTLFTYGRRNTIGQTALLQEYMKYYAKK